jgi:hypothetical protein
MLQRAAALTSAGGGPSLEQTHVRNHSVPELFKKITVSLDLPSGRA